MVDQAYRMGDPGLVGWWSLNLHSERYMSDNNIELTRRRVLGGIATVGAASAAVGAGTFAAFSDTEESTGNTISAGTLDLESDITTSLSLTGLKPGDDKDGNTVTATYSSGSTMPAAISLGLSLSENEDEATEPASNDNDLSPNDFAKKIKVDAASISAGDATTYIVGDSNNSSGLDSPLSEATEGHPSDDNDDPLSYIDLYTLVDEADYNELLSSVSAGTEITLSIDLSMPTEVGNKAQADSADLGVTFIADQEN
ncbi:hypothetical protein Harman_25850 [Haloarcula mannanilytica]|uniref:SipW-cognate class signal peptide n=1 Tax=Haloarcula mannanilytica TaxID=2509225 RepID=A0A4C2EMN9_9EURY|nr:TasA family protein [Haloarcula mannanilytica]GCF14650.1 hypothetical protein Harman_25850 [Haloarcula mannanilytica]